MVADDVRELWEPWMVEADKLLNDEELIEHVYDAQGERHEHSRTRGRGQTPAEIVLRLLLLKNVRNWSYDILEREVRANLAYRDFARVGLSFTMVKSPVPVLHRHARGGSARLRGLVTKTMCPPDYIRFSAPFTTFTCAVRFNCIA